MDSIFQTIFQITKANAKKLLSLLLFPEGAFQGVLISDVPELMSNAYLVPLFVYSPQTSIALAEVVFLISMNTRVF